jgi:putative ABC transport system permease protein
VEAEARKVPGVTGAEGWILRAAIRERPDRTESRGIALYGVPPNTRYLRPEMVSGRWLKDGDTNAIVIDDGFIEKDPDVSVGTLITLKIRSVEEPFRVVGIQRGDLMNTYAYTSREYLDGVLAAHGGVETLMVGSAGHDADTQSAVARRLTDEFSAKQMKVTDSITLSSLRQIISDSLQIVVVFLLILAALLAAVGGIGLSGTMSINVLESTREIGVMRAVGASNAAIYQIFVTEGVVVGLVSWAFGVLVSLPIGLLLTTSLSSAMGFTLTFAYSPAGVFTWLLFVIFLSVLASLLPAYRAARVSVAEAITYE